MHLTQDRDQWWAFVNMIMNIRFPQKKGNFLTSLVTVKFWRTLLHAVSQMHTVGPFVLELNC
jgi:hypothetical protein